MTDKVWVKIKKTGVVTEVSQEYLDAYEGDGWLFEVADPNLKKTVAKPKKVEVIKE